MIKILFLFRQKPEDEEKFSFQTNENLQQTKEKLLRRKQRSPGNTGTTRQEHTSDHNGLSNRR